MSWVTTPLAPNVAVHSLIGEHSSHLLVVDGAAALIDCHSSDMPALLRWRGLPSSGLILHTHIQSQHCREGGGFPAARILVPVGTTTLAADPTTWAREAATLWDDPMAWGETMGRERWGIAGAITHRPPTVPLTVVGELSAGQRVPLGDGELEVIALPAHSPYAIGFVLHRAGAVLATFTGDLLLAGGLVPNLYDLEFAYGVYPLATMPALLRAVAERGGPLFPATGPVISDGPGTARLLATRIEALLAAQQWRSGTFTAATAMPLGRTLGRWEEAGRDLGIWQLNQYGNVVLLIDREGNGLIVDPGPCDYGNARRNEDFIADLQLCEREAGLKRIEAILITHIHGDHYDMADLVLARYPGCRVAAWDLVARIITAPRDFPYPALLPWYNVGRDLVSVGEVIASGAAWRWREVVVEAAHGPGHCHGHAIYFLSWRGLRLALTGDVVQTRGDSCGLDLGSIVNDSFSDQGPGSLDTFRLLADRGIDLNLGGHGSRFIDCAAVYRESVRRYEHAMPFLRALVPGGDLGRAGRRPDWPRLAV